MAAKRYKRIDLVHKSQNAPVPYPIMCTFLFWMEHCGYGTGAFWDQCFMLFTTRISTVSEANSMQNIVVNLISLMMKYSSWWHHQMETFSALLALYTENSPVTGEIPIQRPVMRNFDVFFDLRPNKQLSKQSRGWWFEMPPGPLWSHCNVMEWFSSRFTQPKQINITLIQVTIEVFLLYSLVYFIVR